MHTPSDFRSFLKKGDTVTLFRKNQPAQPMTFTVRGIVGSGSAAVCYLAEANGQRGRLKEFYPAELAGLSRSGTNQLICTETDAQTRFAALCADYADVYDALEKAKCDCPELELLNNFIPPYEILLGRDDDGNPSGVYVWTASDKVGRNFEDYIQEVRANPEKLPAHKLYNILNALVTLTDCVRVLHNAGLLYLDIKPGNFLVPYNGEMNINTGSISLFDLDSLCVSGSCPKVQGTEGFRAPELSAGEASVRSDIYSIGAMLFYAIILQPASAAPHYQEEYYPRLEQLLEDSLLLRSCSTASSPSVRFLLLRILQNCLAGDPKLRYASCDALMTDLISARTYLLPDIFGRHLGRNRRLAILDTEPADTRDPAAAMQMLLHRSPLYSANVAAGEPVRVLVVGAGTYGQSFIDACLQTGQMHSHPLQIVAASRDRDLNRSVYLHYRPALTEFVDVDGAGCRGDEPYATLDFVELTPGFERGDHQRNLEAAARLLQAYPCHYIFIALGEDDLNRDVACAFLTRSPGCPVHFVVQSTQRKPCPEGTPLYINLPSATDALSKKLEDMAFTTHLVWCNAATLDIEAERKRFLEQNNYLSSLSFVLSIPYKLKDLVPLCDDPARLAEDFSRTVLEGDETLFRSLVTLEHRRWVLEKVTRGWTLPRRADGSIDYALCIRRGSIGDAESKTHPCLLRSTERTPLSRPDFDWSRSSRGLDPLDAMSVELHQALAEAADSFRRSQPLEQADILWLRRLAESRGGELKRAFLRYLQCLQRILDGARSYSKNYPRYEEDLFDAITADSPALSGEAAQRLRGIRRRFFAARECCMFRNYKENDEVLVRSIPHILTNRPQPYLAMAFDDARDQNGRNDAIFANVASASVLHPAKLTYLYIWQPDSDAVHFADKASVVLEYFVRRHIRTQIAFLIALPETCPDPRAELMPRLEELQQTTGLAEITFVSCARTETAPQTLVQLLSGRRTDLFDGSTRLCVSPAHNHSFLSRLLEKDIPYFEFDRDTQTFPVHTDCDYLSYIRGNACLRIEDMFALMRAEDNRYHHPEFADTYRELWDIYTGAAQSGPYAFRNAVTNWTQLCLQLSNYFDRKNVIADINLDPYYRGALRHTVFYVPSFGYHSVKKLLEYLIREEVLTDESTVCSHTSDCCRIDLFSPWNLFTVFERIFSNHLLLADPSYLDMESYFQGNNRRVILRYDYLTVRDLTLEDRFSATVLEQLARKRFISGFHQKEDNPQCVSFTIPSRSMKKLLTTAGEILEVYCYYEILNTGYFDDLACGFEFRNDQDVVSELDCVMTKGFRSILVECKARKQLDQNFYHKLLSLSEQFGIGMKRVLISNAYETSSQLEETNQMQISRGSQMGIITIHEPDEIMQIGETMRRIMEGTY